MTENTNTELTVNTNAETEAVQETTPEVGLTGQAPLEEKTAKTFDYDGIPEDIFDGETLSKEKLKSYLNANGEKTKASEKRINDLRSKLSKKDKPETSDSYFYKNEKYDKYIENDESISNELSELKKECHEEGIGQKDFEFLSNKIFERLEKFNPEYFMNEEDKSKFIEGEMSKLGDNAQTVIDTNVNFIKEHKHLNEAQKNSLFVFMNKGAENIQIVNALRGHTMGANPIPIKQVISDGLPSDAMLREEYKTSSDARKQEIIMKRHEVGRGGRLFDND